MIGTLIDVSISYAYTPTRIVSWCLPSNGENSLMHTSKPLELTFSNHTYTASLGFVARVYFAETNTIFANRRYYYHGDKIIRQSFDVGEEIKSQ